MKLVEFQGPFVWHKHDHEDELFLIVKGQFTMEFRDRHVLLFERATTLNTGDVRNERTVTNPPERIWNPDGESPRAKSWAHDLLTIFGWNPGDSRAKTYARIGSLRDLTSGPPPHGGSRVRSPSREAARPARTGPPAVRSEAAGRWGIGRTSVSAEKKQRMRRPAFDYTLDFENTDFRQHRERYRIGKGEQGVFLVEPYKSEILPHWRFETVAKAKESSAKIYKMFLAYLKAEDFPGADMARKFLQMGWTRARRYANHEGGRKYDETTGVELPRTVDAEKAAAAAIFYERYVAARQHAEYVRQKKQHQERYEAK